MERHKHVRELYFLVRVDVHLLYGIDVVLTWS